MRWKKNNEGKVDTDLKGIDCGLFRHSIPHSSCDWVNHVKARSSQSNGDSKQARPEFTFIVVRINVLGKNSALQRDWKKPAFSHPCSHKCAVEVILSQPFH